MNSKSNRMVVYLLCGLPGSGKSSFRDQLAKSYNGSEDLFVYSTDDYIEEVARRDETTYSDIFKNTIDDATSFMNESLEFAIKEGKTIIWDQVNHTRKKRQKIMNKTKIAHGYDIVCCYFPVCVTHYDEWRKRLEFRPGKEIRESVLQKMISSFEEPQDSEGFNYINRINSFGY